MNDINILKSDDGKYALLENKYVKVKLFIRETTKSELIKAKFLVGLNELMINYKNDFQTILKEEKDNELHRNSKRRWWLFN